MKRSAFPNALVQLMLRAAPSQRLNVLAYHRVLREFDPLLSSEPTAEGFKRRMHWVATNFNVLPLLDAIRALGEDRLPRRALAITFDDGYADNYEVALPILQELGLPATFFIATGYVDGGCMFNDIVIEAVRRAADTRLELEDLGLGNHPLGSNELRSRAIDRILERLKYFEPQRRTHAALQIARRCGAPVPTHLMMTSEQVRALAATGMAVGAHTVTHPILAEIPLERAREEMAAGRARLEEITGAPVRLFAYPNGRPHRDYTPAHVALARELGFEGAVSSVGGAARPGEDLFQIPRFTPWDRPNWRFGLRLATTRLASTYARG